MAVIYIDDEPYTVDPRTNLLAACLQHGIDLPYFCWHPALGSVGACRQCAVTQYKDETDRTGQIVMACMTPAADGTRVSVNDAQACEFRASVIEWLMINHPHDCPVCEEGGECHLQDMTVLAGHTRRRYRFTKRTHRNQYLGPFIKHEMNRCIACYRCVRFYREYAGGVDLDVFAMHRNVYFGRHADGPLESEFSGNLVEVCPTGVFTDKPLARSYTRKWDLRTSPSICVHCAVGCNTSPGARYGTLKRVQNRYNGAVNGYFLCDRGRFGYGFVNSAARIREPEMEAPDGAASVSPAVATARLQALLGQGRLHGIGSPRASLEANFALRRLVGAANFSTGQSAGEQQLAELVAWILREGPASAPSLHEMEQADAVLILGEDPTATVPRVALSLRQALYGRAKQAAAELDVPEWHDAAVRNSRPNLRHPCYILTPATTRLDDVAHMSRRAAPSDVARLGQAIAHALHERAPAVTDLSEGDRDLVENIAESLRQAQRPLIVSGTGCASAAVIQAAANIAWALCDEHRRSSLCLSLPECNSLGVTLLGGRDVPSALDAVCADDAAVLIVLENDLYRRAGREQVEAALAQARHVIVLDALRHATTGRAGLLLPAASFAESEGTLVSYEGRAQRFFPVCEPSEAIRESWRWLEEVSEAAPPAASPRRLDDLTRDCAQSVPALQRITEAAPAADFRIADMKIAREPHRYSGRTAKDAHLDVAEPKPPQDLDSPLTFTMEGYAGRRTPPALRPYFWAPRWNSIQAVNKFQDEIAGPLQGGDPGVRLIEADPASRPEFFSAVPAAFAPHRGEWMLAPLPQIFGSEELSAYSPPVAERIAAPFIALHPDDAATLGVGPESLLEVSADTGTCRLAVRLNLGVPRGVAGLPTGAAECSRVARSERVRLRRVIEP